MFCVYMKQKIKYFDKQKNCNKITQDRIITYDCDFLKMI